jgi:glycosyltransferase involved in cell wall biosynthesis
MQVIVDCTGQRIHNEGGRTYVEYFLPLWAARHANELQAVFSRGEVPPSLVGEEYVRQIPTAIGRSAGRRLSDLHVALPKLVRQIRPDVAYFPNNVLSIGLPRNLPAVVAVRATMHYHYPRQFTRSRRSYLALATRHVVTRAGRIIVPSTSTADDLMRHAGAPREKLVVIPHGVDLERFSPSDVQRTDSQTFLFVSRPHDYKGLVTAFRALQEARRTPVLMEARLLVADSGIPLGEQQRLQEVARTLDIEAAVEFLGRVEHGELADLYRTSCALVAPTSHESFGNPYLEAAASGCAIITGRGFGIDPTIGPVAHQVDALDHRRIAASMRAVASLSSKAREAESLSLRRWAEGFSWERTVDDTRRVIAEVIG